MKRLFGFVLALGFLASSGLVHAEEAAADSPKDGRPEPLQLLRLGELEVDLQGMLQFQGAVVGSQSLLDNGDAADGSGFRVRRARLGVSGRLIEKLTFQIEFGFVDQEDFGGRDADLERMDDLDSVLEEASLAWQPLDEIGVAVGSTKVPFSKGNLDSSRDLQLIQRPFAVEGIVPERRLGLSLGGGFWENRIRYSGGIFNSSPGFFRGQNFGGVTLDGACPGDTCFAGMVAGRIEFAPLGVMPKGQSDFQRDNPLLLVGGGVLYDAAAASNELAASADLSFRWMGISLMGEFLWSNRELVDAPAGDPQMPTNIEKNGWYVQLGYMLDPALLSGIGLEAAFRFEQYDDNHAAMYQDTGDLRVITGGLNAHLLDGHLKLQLNFIRKMELFGSEIENDALLGQAQWRF